MPSTVYTVIQGDVSPLPNDILVIEMEKGGRITRGGIIIADDNGKDRGIRPRWARVYKVGKNIDYVQPDEWVLMEHGRWTYGVEIEFKDENGKEITHYIQKIEPEAILLVSDELPSKD